METRTIKAVIPNNGTTSQELDFEGYLASAFDIPVGFNGTAITFTASSALGGTYRTVYDDSGIQATAVVAENRFIPLASLFQTMAPIQFCKLVCGTAQVGVAGARTYPITTNAVANDTVTINGVTFTASAATQDATHFVVGVDATATATNLKTALNANTTISALYTATDATGTVTLTEKVVGGLNNPTAATKTGTIVIGAGTTTASVSGERTITISLKR